MPTRPPPGSPGPSCRLLAAAILALGLGAWGACAARGAPSSQPDPMSEVRNPRATEKARIKAIDAAWKAVLDRDADRTAVREDLKTLAWSARWPEALRVHALKTILSDPDAAGEEDSRRLIRLMLPREQQLPVISVLCETAAARGWDDALPAMVRSLSRFDAATADADRPEYRSIARLRPGTPVADAVLAVFVNPPDESPGYGAQTAERVRADAWEVLARLDPAGDVRVAVLTGETPTEDRGILALRACLRELHALPRAGEELHWLWSLRREGDRANGAWWAEAAAAVAPLYDERGRALELRHAEPIRWASRRRPEWLKASRAELLSELEERLRGRSVRRRVDRETNEPARPERLEDHAARLTWGDLVAILVVDEAIHDPAVIGALDAQANLDREDKSAEYGGLLEAWRDGASADGPADGASDFRVVLYPPRPGQRRGDREFVASSDMVAQSDRALAHYHFHVQQLRNSGYAGPASADLQYAARLGRTCLVFTSVSEGLMNADLYQPDGVVIDLGDVRRP